MYVNVKKMYVLCFFNCFFLLSQIPYITFTAKHLGMRSGRNRGLRRVGLYTHKPLPLAGTPEQSVGSRRDRRVTCQSSHLTWQKVPLKISCVVQIIQACLPHRIYPGSRGEFWRERGAKRGGQKIPSGRIRWKSHPSTEIEPRR